MKPLERFRWQRVTIVLCLTFALLLFYLRPAYSAERFYQTQQFTAAIVQWQRDLQSFEQNGDRANQAAVLSNLAMAYQQLGQWDDANAAIAQSLMLLNGRKEDELNAQVLTIQGSLQLNQGQAEQALTTWQNAAKYLRNPDAITRNLINQTQALRSLGFYQRAKTQLEQINQTLKDQPDSLLKATGLIHFGDALRLVGDVAQSETVLKQSLAIARSLNSPPDIARALLALGNTVRGSEGLQYYQDASAIAPADLKLQIQLNQLRLLIETDKQSEAQELLPHLEQQLSAIAPSRTTAYAYVNLAKNRLKLSSNKAKSATLLATAIKQAQQLKDHQAESYALGYLGELYEHNHQWREARSLTEEALNLAQSSNATDIAYRWQWQLGRLQKAQGQITDAIASYNSAIASLSSIRQDLVASNLDLQFSFRESVEPVYRQFVGLLLQPVDNEISQANLRKARDVIESLQIAELDNFFRESCLSNRPTQIDTVDPTAAILYPIILSDRLEVVLSIPNQPLRHYSAPVSQTELDQLVSKMRKSYRQLSRPPERHAIGKTFYDLLIRPAEAWLTAAQIKTLVFVLDGPLRNVPMATLYDGQHYLTQNYGLAIVPGLQLLAARSLTPNQLQVLVGGLSEARHGFVPLPGVAAEVDQIKARITSRVLFNESFTSDKLQDLIRSTPFPVIHLATHGQFSSNAQETFVLAWDRPITVKQLGDLMRRRSEQSNQPIELLVLSACETANGDRRAALGLAGVAVRSGARSTVATLWSVNDEAASLFMQTFYRELSSGTVTKVEALHRAQNTLIQTPKFQHPFYWAPFILVGSWL
jgi:CHAT domain-containing protein